MGLELYIVYAKNAIAYIFEKNGLLYSSSEGLWPLMRQSQQKSSAFLVCWNV